jgi:hypothetical protein
MQVKELLFIPTSNNDSNILKGYITNKDSTPLKWVIDFKSKMSINIDR